MNNRFDQNAASWDEKEYRIRLAENIAAAIQSQVPLHADMDLLDFGCGTGLVSLSLAAETKSLTGVDTSAGMLAVFKEKATGLGLANVTGINLNLDDGDHLPGMYDLIISSMTFHHVKNITRAIESLVRALKPGGHLCIADLDSDFGLFHSDNTDVHHFGFEREVMMEHFRSAGLIGVGVSTATTIRRVGEDQIEREFKVFLVTGQK
jgi:ubiquinone/menaquinone biosynthesis C-methylase UbiE